jgi:type I restriction enzyme S subunit
VCELVNGDAYKENDWDTHGLPIIRIQNLNNPQAPFNYWSGPTEDRVCVANGDLLLAWSGTPGTSFGAHIWQGGPAVLNQHIFLVRTSSVVDRPFARWAINEALEELIQVAHGAVGLAHVTKREVQSLIIPLPPLSEQRRIAGILREQMAAVERARAAARARLEAVKALPAAFLRQVFPQPAQPLPPGWRRVRLGEVGEIVTGSTPPRSESRFFGGRIPWVKPDDLDREMYVASSAEYLSDEGASVSRLLPRGAVLVSCIGKVGKVAIAGCLLATNQQINSVIPGPDTDSEFLYFLCQERRLELGRAASVALLPILNKNDFASFIIPLPPLSEQRRIAAILREQMAAVERARAAAEAELEAIEALPAALLRRAFSGEL